MALPVTLRLGRPGDIPHLRTLFTETVQDVCYADYEPEQIQAWIQVANEPDGWTELFVDQYLVIAECGGSLAGFATLAGNACLEMLYVGKHCQRQGVATQLLHEIELEALGRGSEFIVSDVSITAKPFFETMGFEILQKQQIVRHGITLINYRMKKHLPINLKPSGDFRHKP